MTSTKPGSGSGLSRRTIAIGFGVAVAAAAVLVAVALLLQGGDSASGGQATDLSGIPQEGAFLGNPDADVLLIEYADMQCPFCRDYAVDVFPTLVEEYVRPGDVRMEFRGLAFLPGPSSEAALRYVVAAGLQNHGWEMQEAFFLNHGEEGTAWVTEELARELGAEIDGLDVDRMIADADSAQVTDAIQRMAQQGQADSVPGTPAFFIQIGDDEPYLIQVPLEPSAFRAALEDALQG